MTLVMCLLSYDETVQRLTRWGAAQRVRDAAEIRYDRLDTVPFPFYFGLETFHLVAIEGIGDILLTPSTIVYEPFYMKRNHTRRILTVAMMARVDNG